MSVKSNIKSVLLRPVQPSPIFVSGPSFPTMSSRSTWLKENIAPYFRAVLLFCHRQDKTMIKITGYTPEMKNRPRGCIYCDDYSICSARDRFNNLKRVDEVRINKSLKHEVILFKEEGAETEFTVGRFTFKLKGNT